jgi:transposase
VDDTGKIAREVKVASGTDALLAVLMNPAYCFKRVGLEAGPLSQWLFSALAEAARLYRPVHVKTLRSQKLRIHYWVDPTRNRQNSL